MSAHADNSKGKPMSARGLLASTFLGMGALFTASAAAPAMAAQAVLDSAAPVRAVAAAPVPVTALKCDGDTGKCTANLQFGDGKWVAEWNVSVVHQAAASVSGSAVPVGVAAAAPVPVTALKCDGDTGKCTANLQFGDGKWVAQWNATVLHP
jgi:hypothetical protein